MATKIAAAVSLLITFPVVLLGFGVLAGNLLKLPRVHPEFVVARGVAMLLILGGILNALSLAYDVSVWSLTAVGLGIGLVYLGRQGRSVDLAPYKGPSLIAVCGVIGFVVWTQFPPRVYNYGDDFMKYFAHPMRMLQTGTIFGSELSSVGLETLGGQAFLQSFLVSIFPIEYINGTDAVLGLMLCMALTVRVSARAQGYGRFCALAGILLICTIDPEYVNISALYTAAFVIMALSATGNDDEFSAVEVGLYYAALVSLKTTLIVFVGVHFAVLSLRWVVLESKKAKRELALLGISFALALSPWLFVHLPSYATRPHWTWPNVGQDIADLGLFSITPLPYGGRMIDYTLLILVFVGCGLLICLKGDGVNVRNKASISLVVGATLLSYLIFFYGFGPLSGYRGAVRFFIPVAIGALPVCLPLIFCPKRLPRWAFLLAVTGMIVVAGVFSPSLLRRVQTAHRNGSMLPFSSAGRPLYRDYNDYVLAGRARSVVEEAQAVVPAGQPLLVWINYPFHLDFRRNAITDIDVAGLATPWAHFPAANYVMWQRDALGTRSEESVESLTKIQSGARERVVSVRTLAAMRLLDAVTKQGELVYRRESISVYRVKTLAPAF